MSRILGGFALMEKWEGKRGMKGISMNTYDPSRKSWHQTWVDDHGGFLLLDGGLVDGSMVLQGSRSSKDGALLPDRIRWTPTPGGTVRQVCEVSTDEGATWKTIFHGLYRRRSGH